MGDPVSQASRLADVAASASRRRRLGPASPPPSAALPRQEMPWHSSAYLPSSHLLAGCLPVSPFCSLHLTWRHFLMSWSLLFCCPGTLAHSRGAACSRKGFHGAVSCERAWQLHQRAARGTYRCRTLPPRLTVATELLAPRTPEAHASAQLSRCATHRRASYALGPLVFVLFHYYYCVNP